MNEMFYRQSALDCIANGLLKNYRNGMYLYGAPRSIPIEEIIEVEYKLRIETDKRAAFHQNNISHGRG